ncbi:hypothetical protein TNCV_3936391 [Trichonephila clavipes]|nr:hypothetical protein TNCV_3936391 [Trichonephila clavipes]
MGICGSQWSRNTSETHFLRPYVCKPGWRRYPLLLRSSGIIREGFGTRKIRFQILIPHPETHTGLTFNAPAHISSVPRGNKNPDAGLECKAFPPHSSNIRQKKFYFVHHPEIHQKRAFPDPRLLRAMATDQGLEGHRLSVAGLTCSDSKPSSWRGVEVWRSWCKLRCRLCHLTVAQNDEVHLQ